MNCKNKLFAVSLLLLSFSAQAQQIGERVGPQFPTMRSSGRLGGLADAGSAITDQFYGFDSNPSTLGFMKKSVVDYSTQRVAKGITFEHLGFAYKITNVEALAFSFDILHFGGTDFYTDGDVRSLGFEARTGISYGRQIAEGLSAGINLQAITATTGLNAVWAFAGDFGFIYAPGRYIRYALEVKGLATDYDVPTAILKTDAYSFRIPKMLIVGMAFDYPFDDQNKRLVIGMQNEKILGEQSLIYRFGIEYTPQYSSVFRYSFRAGFLVRGLDVEPRLGLGLSYAQLQFDYAYRYAKRDNQPSHTFALSFLW